MNEGRPRISPTRAAPRSLFAYVLLFLIGLSAAFVLFSYYLEGGDRAGGINLTPIFFLIAIAAAVVCSRSMPRFAWCDAFVGAFTLVILVRSLVGSVPEILAFIRMIVAVPGSYVLGRLLGRSEVATAQFLVTMAVGGTVLAALALIFGDFNLFSGGRITFGDINPIALGLATGATGALLIGFLFYPITNRRRRLASSTLLLGFAVCALATLASGSRGPTVFLIIVLALVGASSIWNLGRGSQAVQGARKSGLALFSVVILMLGLVAVGLLPTAGSLIRLDRDLEEDPSIQARFVEQEAAWAEFQANPILGSGLNSASGPRAPHPHNIVLDVLSSFGLLGAVTLLPAVVFMGIQAFRLQHRVASRSLVPTRLLACAGPVVIFLILLSSTSLALDQHRWLFIFGGLLTSIHIKYRTAHLWSGAHSAFEGPFQRN